MPVNRYARLAAGLALGLVASSLTAVPPVAAQGRGGGRGAQPPEDPIRFQMMGPSSGGRVASITGVPGDTATWYLGAASGGVWKSTNGGASFEPVFDSMPAQAIGALAVAPSNPKIVWAGTGEAWAIRDADVMGNGIYKSTDAGETWTHMGLPETGRIGRIIVNPRNPNIVFVCALGRATGPQPERGVYRTRDGGKTWERVLFVDPNTGCSGLTMDAHNSNVLFAGMWEVVMHTWAMFSGGSGSGIWVSRNGGTTWSRVEDPGLPKSPLGKIDVAVAPTNSRRVYALIQTANQGSVWRSDDGGRKWQVVSWDRTLIGRAGYYIHLAVSSRNADEILLANSSFFQSTDGGHTWQNRPWGGDNHDIWIDPKNADHFGLTNDAGARLTTNHGETLRNVSLPIGQMYHVAVDNQVPYWIYSNRQDDGTMRGPSDAPEAGARGGGFGGRGGAGRGGAAGRGGTAGRGAGAAQGRGGRGAAADTTGGRGGRGGRGGANADSTAGGFGRGSGPSFRNSSTWDHGLGGCESGFTLPDLNDPNIVWASCYGNEVTRYDHRLGEARSVSPWIHTLDSPPADTKYRCHWTPPLAIDPFDQNTVYYGCQVIFKTSDKGQHWQVISPDLSTNDPSRIAFSGGIIGDNLGQFYGEVVFAIAPSDIQRGLIWAGTNDGQLWYTTNGGGQWTNVTANMTGLPPWGTIRQIAPSPFDPGTAYVTIDFHIMDDRKPYIYKTTDYGKSWTRISDGLPQNGPLDYAMSVAENPNRKGMLFAGTGNAFWYSLDDGAHWTQLQNGLPQAPVTWIVVPKRWHDIVVSTYGRGIFILHDITALEQEDRMAAGQVHFYAPRPGYRQARSGRVDLTFSLPKAPQGRVTMDILDPSDSSVIRTLPVRTRVGRNRVSWDLRYDGPKQVALRTLPPDDPHIWEDSRFRNRDTRPIVHWGIQGPERQGPIAAPGRYLARLTVDGQHYVRPFDVVMDPSMPSLLEDVVASTKTQVRIRDDMNESVDMINQLEVMRKQLEDQKKANAQKPDILASLDSLDQKMLDVELRLLSKTDLYSDDKWYVEAYKVYMNLIWLSGVVGNGAGDVAGGADYRPTAASLEVLAMIEKDLAAARNAYDTLVKEQIPAFNQAMTGKVPAVNPKIVP